MAHPPRPGDDEANKARGLAQREHRYRYEPRGDGYAAICACGDEFTADTRERVAELIGGHVERHADSAGEAARREVEREQRKVVQMPVVT